MRRGRGGALDRAWCDALDARVTTLGTLSEADRRASFETLAGALRRRGHDASSGLEALAHAVRAAIDTLGLVPHAAQRLAARELLAGRFVEMATGEGKTLATALAAAAAALDGTPVHVLTANDYLAERDAARLAPFYAALGIDVACVRPTMDEAARRAAYRSGVVHATGQQVAFDWMRDALAGHARAHALAERLGALTRPTREERAPPITRGLCLAIVDEADSLLVDDARTPLVLAAPRAADPADEREGVVALALARLLRDGEHFRRHETTREVRLTEAGERELERHAARIAGVWRASRYRDERVRQALAALHLWRRDHDYIVSEGAVVLVDERSGRSLPDRRLQQGLHRLIELKERCAATSENEVVASLPFQRFFLRYARLAGTSGTLAEARGELARVYGARVVALAPTHPSARLTLPARVVATRAAQLDALVADVRERLGEGRAVLIGTRSVEQSAGVAARLAAHGIAHRVLNAAQDADEAAVVRDAGRRGRVTVATNMAGRGTDIAVDAEVARAGGLHVVSLAFNDARRIERQLAGRAARQGAPGSYRLIASLDDAALRAALPAGVLRFAEWLIGPEKGGRRAGGATDAGAAADTTSTDGIRRRLGTPLALLAVRVARRRVERRHARERLAVFDARERLARHLAIGGHPDDPA